MLESLTKTFHSVGYTLQRAQPYSWKIFHSTESDKIENEFYKHRYPFCDVFVMRKVKGRFVLKDKTGQNAWPQEYYTDDQIINRTERQFGDYTLCCPSQPEEYLTRTYGDSWAHVGATHFFNHKSAGLLRQVVFDIEADQLKPAVPFF